MMLLVNNTIDQTNRIISNPERKYATVGLISKGFGLFEKISPPKTTSSTGKIKNKLIIKGIKEYIFSEYISLNLISIFKFL